MLRPGRYTLLFSYQPQWKDASWVESGFGLVRSQPVTVEITEPAPEDIATARMPLRLHVRREGEALTAEVESTWDRDLWINLNFGDDLDTHARLIWRLHGEDISEDDGHLQW